MLPKVFFPYFLLVGLSNLPNPYHFGYFVLLITLILTHSIIRLQSWKVYLAQLVLSDAQTQIKASPEGWMPNLCLNTSSEREVTIYLWLTGFTVKVFYGWKFLLAFNQELMDTSLTLGLKTRAE